jgi:hypothetical protein
MHIVSRNLPGDHFRGFDLHKDAISEYSRFESQGFLELVDDIAGLNVDAKSVLV